MRILIIGGDAAGMSAAMQVRRRRPEWTVTVLEMGPYTSYSACGIPYYLAGDLESFEGLVVVSPEHFREKRGVDVRTGWEATAVDTAAKRVTARKTTGSPGGEETLAYDRLLFATGAEPIVPPWEGVDLEGVSSLRTLVDTRYVDRLLARDPRRAVIVGAGYIGLEMAEAFRRRGLEVTVVEKTDGVMGGTEEEINRRVCEELSENGVTIRLETEVAGFSGKDGRLAAVELAGGESLPAELAILGLGVRPRSRLAKEAGIGLGAGGAIAVDRRQRTNVRDVFAAGDCAEAWHRVLKRAAYVPLALTANRQGRVAGANLCGDEEEFPGIVGSAVTRTFELVVARTGLSEAEAREAGIPFRTVTEVAKSKAGYFPGSARLWVKLLFREDDHRLLGGWLVGRDPSAGKRCDVLATAVSAEMTIEELADLDLTYAPPFAPVWDPVLQAANKARFELAEES